MSPVNFVADSSSTAYQIGQVAGALMMVLLLLGVPLVFIISLVIFVRSRKKGWLFLVIPSGLLTGLFAVALVGAFA